MGITKSLFMELSCDEVFEMDADARAEFDVVCDEWLNEAILAQDAEEDLVELELTLLRRCTQRVRRSLPLLLLHVAPYLQPHPQHGSAEHGPASAAEGVEGAEVSPNPNPNPKPNPNPNPNPNQDP